MAPEIIDSRILDWKVTLADTIADRASCASFVVAEPGQPLAAVDVAGLDLVLLRGSRTVAEGRGDAVLGNPLRALAWLANSLAPLGGSLRTGQIVAGATQASLPLGDHGEADRAGLRRPGGRLGPVRLKVKGCTLGPDAGVGRET